MDVIAAFGMAERAIKASGRDKEIKLNLIDKDNMLIPKMNITAGTKALSSPHLLAQTSQSFFVHFQVSLSVCMSACQPMHAFLHFLPPPTVLEAAKHT